MQAKLGLPIMGNLRPLSVFPGGLDMEYSEYATKETHHGEAHQG